MKYERLTKAGGYSADLDLTQELGYRYIYQRLSELEDKIESGEIVSIPQIEESRVRDRLPTYRVLFRDESGMSIVRFKDEGQALQFIEKLKIRSEREKCTAKKK